MMEGAGVGVPVFPYSSFPVTLFLDGVVVVEVVGVGDGELDEVVLLVGVVVEAEAREKEIVSLSREMILPGIVAIT